MEKMSPIDWAFRPLKKYATFSGRASRAEFWWFFLFLMIIYFVVMFAAATAAGTGMMAANPGTALVTGSFGVTAILMVVFWLALFIPTLAVQVRRLHDTNRSGWWLGAFWLLYIVYIVMLMRTMAAAATGGQPNLGLAAGVGIFALVVLVCAIVLFVFFCLRGTVGPNRFGDDPYGADVEDVFA